jgi:hypothetical protein
MNRIEGKRGDLGKPPGKMVRCRVEKKIATIINRQSRTKLAETRFPGFALSLISIAIVNI